MNASFQSTDNWTDCRDHASEHMAFRSSASDPIFGVQSSDEKTPVLRLQEAKNISRRPSVEERRSLTSSHWSQESSKNNIPEVFQKMVYLRQEKGFKELEQWRPSVPMKTKAEDLSHI